VTLTRLIAMFLALSLLFGPLAMDRAMGAPASHSQMVDDDHCQPSDADTTDEAMPDPCCAATAAVAPQASANEILFTRIPATAARSRFCRGVLSEISTPPPRLS